MKKPTIVEKKVGGDKNGGTRQVNLVKSKRYYPTAVGRSRRVVKRNNVTSKTKLRGSLVPGTICILVAGRHAGRRVVFLKQLKSGLLLVTGKLKFTINVARNKWKRNDYHYYFVFRSIQDQLRSNSSRQSAICHRNIDQD